ncbi:MAG: hypothetical protein IKW30_04495 [Lachnospiraceae bacterium]|nr:hypothetical protein [Lachnospiraceae bacterium]
MRKTLETKIKYILVADKIYRVTQINFVNLIIEASETDLVSSDIPAEELFCLSDFKEFKVKFRNWKGNIVRFPGVER